MSPTVRLPQWCADIISNPPLVEAHLVKEKL
jgi:hypothetical protein